MDHNQHAEALEDAIHRIDIIVDSFAEVLHLEMQDHEQTEVALAQAMQKLVEEREQRKANMDVMIPLIGRVVDAIDDQQDKLTGATELLREAKRRIVYLELQLADARGDSSDSSSSDSLEDYPNDSDLDDEEFLERELERANWFGSETNSNSDTNSYIGSDSEDDGLDDESVYDLSASEEHDSISSSSSDESFSDVLLRNINETANHVGSLPRLLNDDPPPPYSPRNDGEQVAEGLAPETHVGVHTHQENSELPPPPGVRSGAGPRPSTPVPGTPIGQSILWAGLQWVWDGQNWLEYGDNVFRLIHERRFLGLRS